MAAAVAHDPLRWALRLANFATAAIIFILSIANTMHRAWGCYGPSAPPSAWDYGMCGYDFPHRNNPPAPVCAQLGGLDDTCHADNEFWAGYGNLISAATHIQAVAMPVIALSTLQQV
jgi:hypothetical protein